MQSANPPSGQFQAATILLLISAILQVVGAAALILVGGMFLVMGAVFDRAAEDAGAPEGFAGLPMAVIAVVYLVGGLLAAVGSVFGFMAHGKARRGDARGAWVAGLVASLLPPLQVVALVGAILALTCPEGQAQRPGAWPGTST